MPMVTRASPEVIWISVDADLVARLYSIHIQCV